MTETREKSKERIGGKKQGIEMPDTEEKILTNFIR